MSEPRPRFILREMLGRPYVRKTLQPDGTYRTMPRVRHSPEFTARLREVAMAEVQRIRAARMGEPPTGMVQ
jgi:hypothetical protein